MNLLGIVLMCVTVSMPLLAWVFSLRWRARMERERVARINIENRKEIDGLTTQIEFLQERLEKKKTEVLDIAVNQALQKRQEANLNQRLYSREVFERDLLDSVDPTRRVRSSIDKGNGQRKAEPPADKPDRWQARIGRIMEDEENEEITESKSGDAAPPFIKVDGQMYVMAEPPIGPTQKQVNDQETKDQIKEYWGRMRSK